MNSNTRKKIKIIPQEPLSNSFLNIEPASSFIPKWYRESKSTIHKMDTELTPFNPESTTSTYKKCTPFFDAITSGYIVFLSADLEVTQRDNLPPLLLWRTQRKIVTEHDLVQWEGLPCPEGYSQWVYKWHNQFGLKTPKNYSLLFTSPFNRFDLPFISLSGIVDTDSYDMAIHFPFFIKNNFNGIIEKGTPIAQIIPIKNEYWERELKEYDEYKVFVNYQNFLSTIKRSYKNKYWKRKEYK
jgi:hypothetical protein